MKRRALSMLGVVFVAAASVACVSDSDGIASPTSVAPTVSTVPCEEWIEATRIVDCLRAKQAQNDIDIATASTEIASLNGDAATRVEASQKSWSTYRDRQCDLEAVKFVGGSQEELEKQSCRLRMGLARLDELRTLREVLGRH